ncbi:restriction endonuclease subunit S [Microbacterium sp. CFBP 8790]|uniref:restriction endonuclease subunit S n=1 Tax=unclassified Microbacterium TaxID=2609290 RepID=UPI001782E2D0|nr:MULTISPECIES: restriction endonuclease subunit S [unclassified Microbacterium]MBD8207774.1 restriction endonuclease subunit S [Microbacterium sp. CFBP 8801]MBD8510342.1 restriction endonuclease subunit S [Microbacterium sp. CFBP 8790]
MSTYHDLTFAPMLITEVFDTYRQAPAWLNTNQVGHGEPAFPHVTNSALGNSVAGFIPRQEKRPNPGNAITIGIDTQVVAYQPVAFYGATKVYELRSPHLDSFNGLVLTSALRRAIKKFSWGYKASAGRLEKTHIMVPIRRDESNEQVVNWEGMTRLGEELMVRAITHSHRARTPHPVNADANLPDLAFEPMFITDVFKTMKASAAWYDKTKLGRGENMFPFVSRTKASNGTDGFTTLQKKLPELGNAITIGLDTQTIAYQPVPFYTSQNIQVLRHPSLVEDNALVLVSCLREQMGKFSWGGNGATLGRLKATRIMVPVTTAEFGNHVVDWEGMTLYGKTLRARAEQRMSPTTIALL